MNYVGWSDSIEFFDDRAFHEWNFDEENSTDGDSTDWSFSHDDLSLRIWRREVLVRIGVTVSRMSRIQFMKCLGQHLVINA